MRPSSARPPAGWITAPLDSCRKLLLHTSPMLFDTFLLDCASNNSINFVIFFLLFKKFDILVKTHPLPQLGNIILSHKTSLFLYPHLSPNHFTLPRATKPRCRRIAHKHTTYTQWLIDHVTPRKRAPSYIVTLVNVFVYMYKIKTAHTCVPFTFIHYSFHPQPDEVQDFSRSHMRLKIQ